MIEREREGLLLLDIFMFDLKCVRNAAAEHRSQFGKRSYENNGKKGDPNKIKYHSKQIKASAIKKTHPHTFINIYTNSAPVHRKSER